MAVNRVAASSLSRPFDLSRSATENASGSGKSILSDSDSLSGSVAEQRNRNNCFSPKGKRLPRRASGSRYTRSRDDKIALFCSCHKSKGSLKHIQRSEKWLVRGWVKFVPALP